MSLDLLFISLLYVLLDGYNIDHFGSREEVWHTTELETNLNGWPTILLFNLLRLVDADVNHPLTLLSGYMLNEELVRLGSGFKIAIPHSRFDDSHLEIEEFVGALHEGGASLADGAEVVAAYWH